MTGTAVQPPGMARLKSGIAGLDSILRGGFLTGGNYLIMGPPGVGKTILGNQLCFHHIAAGGRAIYLSLLAETSRRLLDQLQSASDGRLAGRQQRVHADVVRHGADGCLAAAVQRRASHL